MLQEFSSLLRFGDFRVKVADDRILVYEAKSVVGVVTLVGAMVKFVICPRATVPGVAKPNRTLLYSLVDECFGVMAQRFRVTLASARE